MTRADLDRLKTMRASFFGLLSKNYKWTTVLERSEDDTPNDEQNTSSVA